jgi:hypothetical protein
MDLPKILSMFCTIIGTWDLLPQHLTWFESFFIYPIYKKGTDPNAHVQVFWKAINANGEKDNADTNCLVLHNGQQF